MRGQKAKGRQYMTLQRYSERTIARLSSQGVRFANSLAGLDQLRHLHRQRLSPREAADVIEREADRLFNR